MPAPVVLPIETAPKAPEPSAPTIPDATPDDLASLVNDQDFQAAPYGKRIEAINQIGQGIVQHLQKQPDFNENTAGEFAGLINDAYAKAAPPAPQGPWESMWTPVKENEPAAAAGTGAGIGAGALAAETGPGAIVADLAASSAASAATQYGIDAARGPVATRRAQEQLEANARAHPWTSAAGNAVPFITSMVNPTNWFKKPIEGILEATGKRVARRVIGSATGGARAGGIKASGEWANGSANLIDIPKEMVHDAATMAPLGFIGPAKNILMAMGLKAPAEATVAATSEAIYQRVVNDKPLDLKEITHGAVSDIPGFVLLNALAGMLHSRAQIDRASKTADTDSINGSVDAATPGTGMFQKMRGVVNAYLGKTMAKTTARDQQAGELGARWLSSKISAILSADAYTQKVLADSGIDVHKFGAALVEDNLLSVRDGLLKEKDFAAAKRVESIIGAKDSPFRSFKEFRDFINNPAVRDALERHKQLWEDTVDPMYRNAASIDPNEPLPTRGKYTGARINLFNDPDNKASSVTGNVERPQIQPSSMTEGDNAPVTPSAVKRASAILSKTRIGRLLLRRIQIVPDWQRAIQSRSFSPEEMEMIKRAEGFHDPQTGKSVVITENIRPHEGETPEAAVIRVITHELEGHERNNWMRAHDSDYNRYYLNIARKIPKAELDALLRLYPKYKGNPDALAAEWFAQKAQNLGQGELPDPQSLLGQLWRAIREFLKRLTGQEKGLDQQVRRLIIEGRRTPESLEGSGGVEGEIEPQASQPERRFSTGNPSGKLTNTFRKKSPFARQAFGTGKSYNINYAEQMRNTFARQLETANKNAFEKRLVETGNAVEGPPGQSPVLADGETTIPYDLKRSTIIRRGKDAIPVNLVLYVRKSLAGEYLRADDAVPKDIPKSAKIVTAILNHSALAGLTDGTVHVTNLLTALLTRPGASAGVLSDTLLSAMARADIPITILKTIRKAFQDNRLQIAKLSEIGAMKARGPHTSWFFLSNVLGRFIENADRTVRLAMDDMFTKMVKQGLVKDTETNRREFVNQVGQYNLRAQGALKRGVRRWGISPFVTAGTTFNTLGLRTLTLRSGAEATSPGAAAMLGVNVLAKWMGAVVLIGTLNYLLTKDKGGGVFGRPGVPLGKVDTGLNDKNGNPLSFPLFDLLGLGRPLRVVGARGFIEARRKGLPVQTSVDAAVRDIVNTNSSPFLGPVLRFGVVTATGYQPAIKTPKEAEPTAPGESEILNNFKAAVKDANPILKSYLLSQEPGQGMASALAQQIPRFSLTPSQPPDMMADYPAIVRRAQASQFMEDVIARARKMGMDERVKFVNESLNRLSPEDRSHAMRTLKQRKVFVR